MASLVLYGSSIADSTIAAACQMAAASGGVETTKSTNNTGAAGAYMEVTSKGLTVVPVSSIPGTPTGNGWDYLPGQGTFDVGNWSAAIQMHNSAATDFTLRFFQYSAGIYTLIGSITTAATGGTGGVVYSFAPTAMGTLTFGATDLVYIDLWFQDATGVAGDTVTTYLSNSATAGVANDMQITTANFTPAPAGPDPTVYGSNVLNGTLTTACNMSIALGGVETITTITGVGTNPFGEITPKGNGSTSGFLTIPATPTGLGWVYQPGAGTTPATNWSASIRLNVPPATNATLRFFKWSSGSYTLIGSIVTSLATGGIATYTFANTAMPAVIFGASDLLYMDLWFQDATGIAGDTFGVYVSTSATAGVANDMQVTFPSFPSQLMNSTYIPRVFGGTLVRSWVPRIFGGTLVRYVAVSTGVALTSQLAGTSSLAGSLSLQTALTTTLAGVGTLAGSLVASLALPTTTMAGAGTFSGTFSIPWLSVSATGQIVDITGAVVHLRGFNTSGLEYGDGLSDITQARINALASLFSMNLWRLCINVSWWNNNVLMTDGVTHYQTWIQTVIGWMKAAGCYVEIDPTNLSPIPPNTSGPSCNNPPITTVDSDTFTRANQSGWGTPSGGGSWILTGPATLSIASNEGVLSGTGGNNAFLRIGSNTAADLELQTRFALTNSNHVYAGVFCRWIDGDNCYLAYADTANLYLAKRVGGVQTNLATVAKTFTPGTFYQIKFWASGTQLTVKTWNDSVGEPDPYDIQLTDSSLTAANFYGLYSFDTGSGDSTQFDHYVASTPQTSCIISQNTQNFPPWTEAQMVAAFVSFFQSFVPLYVNDPAILYDAMNEPTYWGQVATVADNNTVINAIRAIHSNSLIFVLAFGDSSFTGYSQPNIIHDYHVYDGSPTWQTQLAWWTDGSIPSDKSTDIGEWNVGGVADAQGFATDIANIALMRDVATTYYNESNVLLSDNATITVEGSLVALTFQTIQAQAYQPRAFGGTLIKRYPLNLSGVFTGAGTLSGAMSLSTALACTFTGVGTLAGTAALTIALASTFPGIGTLAGPLSAALTLTGTTFAGASTVAGSVSLTTPLTSTLSGAGTLAGTVQLSTALAGTLVGIGTIAGTMALVTSLGTILPGVGVLTGALGTTAPVALSVTMAGVGTLSGTLALSTHLVSTLPGVGTLASTFQLSTSLSVTAAGIGQLSGSLTANLTLPSASLPGSGTLSGTVQLTTQLTDTFSGIGALSGALTANMTLASVTLAGVGTLTGTVVRSTVLTTTLAGVGTLAGSLVASLALPTTTMAGVGTLSGTIALSGLVALVVTMPGVGTLTGTLAAALTLPGVSLAGVGQLSGITGRNTALVGTLAGSGTLSAQLSVQTVLVGAFNGVGTAAFALFLRTSLTIQLSGTGIITTSPSYRASLALTFAALGSLSGTLTMPVLAYLSATWVTRDGNATWKARDGIAGWRTRDGQAGWKTRDEQAGWQTRDEAVLWKTRA